LGKIAANKVVLVHRSNVCVKQPHQLCWQHGMPAFAAEHSRLQQISTNSRPSASNRLHAAAADD